MTVLDNGFWLEITSSQHLRCSGTANWISLRSLLCRCDLGVACCYGQQLSYSQRLIISSIQTSKWTRPSNWHTTKKHMWMASINYDDIQVSLTNLFCYLVVADPAHYCVDNAGAAHSCYPHLTLTVVTQVSMHHVSVPRQGDRLEKIVTVQIMRPWCSTFLKKGQTVAKGHINKETLWHICKYTLLLHSYKILVIIWRCKKDMITLVSVNRGSLKSSC